MTSAPALPRPHSLLEPWYLAVQADDVLNQMTGPTPQAALDALEQVWLALGNAEDYAGQTFLTAQERTRHLVQDTEDFCLSQGIAPDLARVLANSVALHVDIIAEGLSVDDGPLLLGPQQSWVYHPAPGNQPGRWEGQGLSTDTEAHAALQREQDRRAVQARP